MAGIQKGSSDNLTSPIPHLLNSDFLTAVARLAPGLIHYAGRDYYQRDTDTHYRLKALSKCFAADGTTPATLPGTWGTLEAHWVTAASAAAAPTNGTNGTNGNRILALAAAPALSDGNLADLAIVSAVGDLYEKTSSGWALRGNLRGPAGTGGTGTATSGVTAFNTRVGSVTLTAADVLSVVSSANQLAGGLHSAANKANMLSIPANLRDYGMTVIVYADSLVANNGRYDLATDLQTFIKQGIDLTGQFQPYNAAILYNSSSAYVTYPDPVSSALRIFHSLALTAPATQPTPVNSSNVLNAVWEEISPSAAAATRAPQATNSVLGIVRGNGFTGATGNIAVNLDGTMSTPLLPPLYPAPGTAVDGPMTQLATTTVTGLLSNLITNDKSSLTSAINEVKNLEFKSASVVLGVLPDGSGGVLTIFPTYEQAEAAASAGSDISLSGFHRSINVDKSVNISGGTVGTAVIGYNSAGITARLHGMSALSRFVSCAPATAGVVTTVEFSDLTTGPGFYLESYGLSTNGTVTISVINCRARNTGPAGATSNGTAGSGLVHFQERTCTSQWNFRNCDLRSSFNVIFSGYPNAASRVTLEAATTLTPGPGKPTQDTQVINSGVTTTDANFYIDNRTGGANIATATTLGTVRGGGNVSINADGSMTATAGGSAYTLPQASPTVLGGLMLGTGLSLNATTGRVDAAGGAATPADTTTCIVQVGSINSDGGADWPVLTASVYQAVPLSVVVEDPGNNWSTANKRYTVPVSGKYEVQVEMIRFEQTQPANNFFYFGGATTIGAEPQMLWKRTTGGFNGDQHVFRPRLTAGQFLYLTVYCNGFSAKVSARLAIRYLST